MRNSYWVAVTQYELRRLYHDQGLAVFDGLGVLYEDAGDATGELSLDLIHHLHGFNDAYRITRFYNVAFGHEWVFARLRGCIEGAHHRGHQHLFALGKRQVAAMGRATP